MRARKSVQSEHGTVRCDWPWFSTGGRCRESRHRRTAAASAGAPGLRWASYDRDVSTEVGAGGRGPGVRPHRVVAVALPDVVAFDLSIAAQIFGHRDERGRYAFSVCAETPGPVMSTTGFAINAPEGLDALGGGDPVFVPGFFPLRDPSPAVTAALRAAAERGSRVASICIGAFAL